MKRSQTPASRNTPPGKRRELWQPYTFVIPAHNEANYLPATLEKLAAVMQEIEFPGQTIVVNDDSTDATGELARSFDVQVVDVKLRNIGAVRNAGARQCETPWLFFLDADTLLPAKTLAAALDQLARGVAGGGAAVELDDSTKISAFKMAMFYALKLGWQSIGGWAAGCFMFCRTSVFDSFGGFDENFFAIEEYFFSKSVASRGEFTLLRQPVVTSARKFHSYSALEIFKLMTLPVMQPTTLFKSKVGLEILYDDDRSR